MHRALYFGPGYYNRAFGTTTATVIARHWPKLRETQQLLLCSFYKIASYHNTHNAGISTQVTRAYVCLTGFWQLAITLTAINWLANFRCMNGWKHFMKVSGSWQYFRFLLRLKGKLFKRLFYAIFYIWLH